MTTNHKCWFRMFLIRTKYYQHLIDLVQADHLGHYIVVICAKHRHLKAIESLQKEMEMCEKTKAGGQFGVTCRSGDGDG